jgi:hypothetical protein
MWRLRGLGIDEVAAAMDKTLTILASLTGRRLQLFGAACR